MNAGSSAIETWAEERDERDRQSLRAGLIASGVGHLAFLFILIFAPAGDPLPMAPVVSVDLLAALPAVAPAPAPKPAPPAAAPKAAPKPPPVEPVVVPPPEPPKQAKTVLPKEAPKAVPKKKPAAKKPARKPAKKTEPLDYEDAMAALREEVGEPSPLKPAEKVVDTPPGASAAGRGRLDPELARWHAGVQALIARTWVVPNEMRERGLVTTLAVTVMADGTLIGVEVKRSSGDPYFDDNAVRALKQAEVLPPPPSAGDHFIAFSSRD